MSTSYEHDQQWFTLHPTSHQYQRAPFASEWPDVTVPSDAIVTVYYINARCLVRVLTRAKGRRVAEAFDTDAAQAELPLRRALDARRPRRVSM